MGNVEETKVENDVEKAPMGQHEYEVKLHEGGILTVRAGRVIEHEGSLKFFKDHVLIDDNLIASVAATSWVFCRMIR